jgi:hypothetical protein
MMEDARPVRAGTGLGGERIVSVQGLYGAILSTRFALLILRCTANPPRALMGCFLFHWSDRGHRNRP